MAQFAAGLTTILSVYFATGADKPVNIHEAVCRQKCASNNEIWFSVSDTEPCRGWPRGDHNDNVALYSRRPGDVR